MCSVGGRPGPGLRNTVNPSSFIIDAACASHWRNTRTSMSCSHPWSDSNLTAAMRDLMDGKDKRRWAQWSSVLTWQ